MAHLKVVWMVDQLAVYLAVNYLGSIVRFRFRLT
jgi:hypothetical protein